MKVSAINLNNFKTQNIKLNKNQKQNTLLQKQNFIIPTTAQYLAFMGGYSVDLKETFEQLKDEQYPFDIQEMVLEEIEKGNPENKTLYDVHFEKYKGILDCYTLDELKEKYPEFMDVNSAFDVVAKDDSFIGKFQRGENEIFATNEDLTLQLIKLYWGQGFSLNGLSSYIADLSQDKKGIQLRYTLEKLNIPLMDRRYASVLKLSNKEYNEKFTQEMSARLKEAKEIKKQQQEGEPVYIPSGPLTEAHKKHISEGLKKHYQEHPEKIFEMSKRQKKFYEEHPERAEDMSIIMHYAWNQTQEGKSLSKHISKFIKKYNGSTITPDELSCKKQMSKETQEAFSAFWKKNKWASKQMSIAVTKGYEHLEVVKQNKINENIPAEERLGYVNIPGKKYIFGNIPTQVRNLIHSWMREKGYNPNDYVIAKGVLYSAEQENLDTEYARKVDDKSKAVMEEFFKDRKYLETLMADSYQLAIVDIAETLKNPKLKYKLPKSLRFDSGNIMLMSAMMEEVMSVKPLYKKHQGQIYYVPEIEKEYMNLIQQNLIYFAVSIGCDDFIDYFQRTVDEKFDERAEGLGIKLK